MKIVVVFPSALEAQHFESLHPNVDVLVSGIGGFSTMYSLTKYCVTNKPDFVIHGGICGSFDNTLQLGEVVNVMIDNFADFGVFEQNKWKTGFEMGLLSSHKVPFVEGQLVAPNNDVSDFPKVVGVTSQTITSNNERKSFLLNAFQPSIESMEGAYVHYVCIKENIPFIHLRAISNYVGERDKSKWQIKLAINNLHSNIHDVISQLNS